MTVLGTREELLVGPDKVADKSTSMTTAKWRCRSASRGPRSRHGHRRRPLPHDQPLMLGQYRRLFSAEGSAAFTLAGVVARYPMGMYGVSILLLMVDTSGSYATAGRVAAVGL